MMNFHALRRVGVVGTGLAALLLLASCGGSDDGNPPVVTAPVSNTPPASASADVGGFIAYVKTVVASSSDTSSPIDLTGFVAPTDDTGPFDTTI